MLDHLMSQIKKYGDRVWPLKRDLVSDGIDQGLKILQEWKPIHINAYETGSECFSWIIPKKWSCQKGELKDSKGKLIFSYEDHPLHIPSYSSSFTGEISREELFKHLHTDPGCPEGVPFKFFYYKERWGLCCSEEQKATLTDETYHVDIQTTFEEGSLKVGEYYIKGESDEEIVFVSHICHPYQFNDDLSGVLGVMALVDYIESLPTRHYSYRFLILPETIGSIAWLSHNLDKIKNMVGGYFLEMLATNEPLAIQKTYFDNSWADQITLASYKSFPSPYIVGNFREIVGNDEKQFNAPGIRVPMLSISRAIPESGETTKHFREYHTHLDTPDNANWDHFRETMDSLLNLVNNIEEDYYVKNEFRGEIFLSRYNLFIDKFDDGVGNKNLFDILYDIDGTHRVSDIANKHHLSFSQVNSVINQFFKNDLVSKKRDAHV